MTRRPLRSPLLLLVPLVVLGCHAGRDVQPQAPAAPPQISVIGDNGLVIGTLTSSEHPPRLIFIPPQGQRLELGQCHDELRQEALGGSGRSARVEVRNCGATVDVATRVLVYGAEGDTLVALFAGQPETRLVWLGANTLAVHQEQLARAQVFVRRDEAASVKVRYVTDRELSGPTPDEDLDFASLNFGASGRGAHLPAELLQRIAGWSQQASGLYEPAWGIWSGAPPFGDDPRGHAQVLAGISQYEEKYGGS
ncbi:MAG: hypothetical protein ABI629_19855 [bacterium]